MTEFDHDFETLERAFRAFFQTMKRPQLWAMIVARAGITIDRPAAIILQILLQHEPKTCRVQDIANQLGIEAPSVTRKTQELERNGYLERRPDPNDKRAVALHITPEGRKVCDKLWKVQRDTMSNVLSSWPADDRARFVRLFERYSQDLSQAYNQLTNQDKQKGN